MIQRWNYPSHLVKILKDMSTVYAKEPFLLPVQNQLADAAVIKFFYETKNYSSQQLCTHGNTKQGAKERHRIQQGVSKKI
jgi:hypothetical protein